MSCAWRMAIGFVVSLAFVSLPGQASAGFMTFTSRAPFLSAAGVTQLESFEKIPDRPLVSDPIATPLFTLTMVGGAADVRSSPSPDGHFPTDGVKYVSYGFVTSLPSGVLDFNLAAPARAFGLAVTDFGDINPGTLSLATDVGEASAGLLVASSPPLHPNGNALYFGFTQDTPFRRVRLTLTTPGDGIGVDQIDVATVPEPSSVLLAAEGLAALLLSCSWRNGRRSERGRGRSG